jgi:TonB-linked SusC/RagA family outer membrane protein
MRKLLLLLVGCSLFCAQLFAQDRSITGKVFDDKGAPLPNATVQVKGTTIGTSSAADGSFHLTVPSTAKSLLISAVGMTTMEVSIGDKTEINVSLVAEDKSMKEVIVVGYGTQKKSEITSSLTKVGGDKIANVPLTSLDQMLQGKAAGLQSITFSGQPGANQAIRIRGIGSISASAQPLFVVDGVQINSGDLSRLSTTTNVLASINPDDIESISVLKDAAAAAIYGARGANGVILITTKKGRAGKTQINFSAEAGTNKVGDVPTAATPVNSAQWLELFKEGYKNTYLNNPANNPALADSLTNVAAAAYGDGSVDINWLDQVTRSGLQQQYNLSAQGGDDKTTFYASGGYFKQEASTIGADLKRITASISLDHKANDKLSFGLSLKPTYIRQNTPVTNGGFFASPVLSIWFLRPTQNPYNADGTLNINNTTKDFSSTYNPIYIAQHDIHSLDRLQVFSDVHGRYQLYKGLSFTTKMGIQYDNLEEYQYNNPFHGDGKAANGRGYSYYTRYFLYDWTNQLDYHISSLMDNNLSIDATVGTEAINSTGYLVNASAQNFSTPILPYSVNASSVTGGTANGTDYAFASLFGRASVGYKSKYYLSGSLRRDGSSRFGSNHEYGTFPAVSAAWNVSKEEFMSGLSFLNDLKVRASYGETGNAELPNYGWRQLFSYGANYNGLPGGTFNTIGNIDLEWEKQKQTDVGFDLTMIKNKVNVIFDWYRKISDGLLFAEPTSQTIGFSSITKNIGAMQNTGVELTVNATPVQSRNFTWDVGFIFTHNKNRVTKIPAGQTQIINGQFLTKPGYDYYSFYMRQWAGVDPANGNPLWYTDSSKTGKTPNYSSTALPNPAQRVITGKTADPKYYGSFNNTFTFKSISLNAEFYYNYGNYVQDTWNAYLFDQVNPSYGKYVINMQRWQKPGDITNVPKLFYSTAFAPGATNNSSNSVSTRFLYKGDYVRLRNIVISWTAPASLSKRLHVRTLSFYARGTNLWTKTYDPNMTVDPEQGVASQSNLNILYNKTLTFGFNMGL